MLHRLPDDVLEMVALQTHTFADVCRLCEVCARVARSMTSDAFWFALAHDIYGAEFWRRALRRPQKTSLPLQSWRDELFRLERFQNRVVRIDGRRFTNEAFYALWNATDYKSLSSSEREEEPSVAGVVLALA